MEQENTFCMRANITNVNIQRRILFLNSKIEKSRDKSDYKI